MSKTGSKPRPLEVRFWYRVDKEGPVPAHRPDLGSCWVWTGGKSKNGYGGILVDGKHEGTHRAAFLLAHGRLPKPCALHHCDNRACVKALANEQGPAHIFEGTKTDNNADKVRKGRQASGDRHGSVTRPDRVPRGDRNGARLHPEIRQGERNGRAKLTKSQVLEVRRLCELGTITKKQIAKQFSVAATLISMIALGQIWRSVK